MSLRKSDQNLDTMPPLRVFTPRSIGIGVTSGALVGGVLGWLVGAAWGLVALNSLASGALALAGSICMRDGRFAFLMENRRWPGVGMLASAAIMTPMFFVDNAIGIELLNREDALALSWLFGFTGLTAYTLGGIMVTLAHLNCEEAAGAPRRHGVAPTPRPSRVFTTKSTGIGIATGALLAIALGQLLGATWGLATLNGLAAGALALAVSTGLRDGLLDTTDNQRWPGLWGLAYAVMIAPPVFTHHYIELRPADEIGLAVLLALTGFAIYVLGGVMATLNHLDDDDSTSDSRLHRVTPPPG